MPTRRNRTDPESVSIIGKLRGVVEDEEIARILNRNGKRTATGLKWTRRRVQQHGSQENYVSVRTASEALGITEPKLQALIEAGNIDAERACKWAPITISRKTLQSPQTQQTIEASKQMQMTLI